MRSDTSTNSTNPVAGLATRCETLTSASERTRKRGDEENQLNQPTGFHSHGSGALAKVSGPPRSVSRPSPTKLVGLVELVEVLENKAKTHNQPGTDSTDPHSVPGSLGQSGTPRKAHHTPDNPRAGESTSGNVRHPVGVGAGVRRLRVESALLPAPAAILSDHHVATWLHPAPFGCDNPPACESAQSVRPGWDVGDRGVGKKVADMRSDHPLHLHSGHQFASPTC